MSPYIVTTTRSCTCQPSECESDGLLYHEIGCDVFNTPRGGRVSRRAVATLEEAQDVAHQAGATFTAASITESGGTVGPLPDGTVIDVYHVDDAVHLASEMGWSASQALATSDAAIIDAFNARLA